MHFTDFQVLVIVVNEKDIQIQKAYSVVFCKRSISNILKIQGNNVRKLLLYTVRMSLNVSLFSGML